MEYVINSSRKKSSSLIELMENWKVELETPFYGKFRSEAEYLILNVGELGMKGVFLASSLLAG